MHYFRVLLVILIAAFFSSTVSAVNKCTDKSGKISFQDKPCKADEISEKKLESKNRDSSDVNNIESIFVKIPGVGDAGLVVYKWWNFNVVQASPNSFATVKMVSKPGEEPISFSISFIPNLNEKSFSVEESGELVTRMASRYVEGSVEGEVRLRGLETTAGTAVFASFTEEKYLHRPIPPGEFSSITVGQAIQPKLAVAFTILTNGTNSKALKEAFNVIQSFQIMGAQ